MAETLNSKALKNRERLTSSNVLSQSAARSAVAESPPECMWTSSEKQKYWVLYFEKDKADVIDKHKVPLFLIRDELNRDLSLVACINGYASPEGDEKHNEELSVRRRASVIKFLFSSGKEDERVYGEGMGETGDEGEKDLSAAEKEKRLSKNRYVEIFLFSPKWRRKWTHVRSAVDGGVERLNSKLQESELILKEQSVQSGGAVGRSERMQYTKELKVELDFWKTVQARLASVTKEKGWEDYKKWYEKESAKTNPFKRTIEALNLALNQAREDLLKAENAKVRNEQEVTFMRAVVDDCESVLKEVMEAQKDVDKAHEGGQ